MSRLEIILSAILLLSLVFNIVIIIYARGAVARLLSVSEELGDLQIMVDAFAKHVKAVYELEMFYGDTVLQNLMDHAVSFNEQLETFEYIYSLTELPQIETEDEEIDEEENSAPQE
jgi:hypothetical protein